MATPSSIEPTVHSTPAADPDIRETKKPRTDLDISNGHDAQQTVTGCQEPPSVTEPPTSQANGKHESGSNGLKRSREAFEEQEANESPPEMLQVLTPRTSPRPPTPDPTVPDHELHYFDDKNHPDFEWIRLPKKRDYDIFQAPRVPSWDRNDAQVPITAIRYSDHNEVTMWAKMDTGASDNTINRSTLRHLLGDSMAATITLLDEPKEFQGAGDGRITCSHSVALDINAGWHRKKFAGILFYVIPDDDVTADTDGLPNVLLGLPTLREHHMLMIDLEFLHDRDHDLEVIAGKMEDERPGQGRILVHLSGPKLAPNGAGPRPGAVRASGIRMF